MTSTHPPQSAILWRQLIGLAALQGAIALMWVIYNLYLPQLLEQFGFPPALAATLIMIESVLAIALEPLVGNASDRVRLWLGTQFPLIALGVVVASALFVGIPVVAVFGYPGNAMRWVLPGVLIGWALAMSLFRSPAMSLLGQYAMATNLPQAASTLTVVGAGVGLVGTIANQWIVSLGPPIAFTVGSLVLLGSTAWLRSLTPSASVMPKQSPSTGAIEWSSLGLIVGIGFSIGLGITLTKRVLSLAAPHANPGLLITIFAVAHLLSVLPAGQWASQWGNRRMMLLGLAAMVIPLAVMGWLPAAATIAAILLGLAFSPVINGTIPLALALVPSERGGLGVGLYFAGAALATSLFGWVGQPWSSALNQTSWLSVLVLLLAGGLILLSDRRSRASIPTV